MGKQRRGRGKPGLWLFSLYLHLFAMLVNFIDILRFLRKKKATVLCSQGKLTPRLIFLSYPPIGKQEGIVIYLLHLICTSGQKGGGEGGTDKKQTKKPSFLFSFSFQFHSVLTCNFIRSCPHALTTVPHLDLEPKLSISLTADLAFLLFIMIL